jgi:subtilase family serine protease
VADPANTLVESSETDNNASLAAFGPDLEIDSAAVDYWGGNDVGLLTLVRNIGTSTAPTSTLAFYREALTGTLAVTDTVPTLAAGETITRTTPWNFGALAAGSYSLVAVINQADFTETFTSNNIYTFTLDVGPDLMVSPYSLWTTPPTGTTVLVTATVYNVGAITATDALVGFYGDDRLDGGSPLFTRTIPQLGPAGSVTLSEQVAGPLACTLYIYANPAGVIAETTRANNLAGIDYRGLCQRVYLPIILRNR